MLTALSIRDVVLIERLDLAFGSGLTALTGETGAGKSILLDSLGLALGMRAEPGMLRAGAAQASVSATFAVPGGHPAWGLLAEGGLSPDDELILRRVVTSDGRSRAFINDEPVSVGLLRRAGALLVEIQGQNEQVGLADPSTHAALLDAFGVDAGLRDVTAQAWRTWRSRVAELAQAEDAVEQARRDEEWLRHATTELERLAIESDEEERLAGERQRLQHGERRAAAIAAALSELAPQGRRGPPPAAAIRAAYRTLQRLIPPAAPGMSNPAEPAIAALERADEALTEAEGFLSRLADQADHDPGTLERIEERLFALRAAARKHGVAVAELPDFLRKLSARLASLENGITELAALHRALDEAREDYVRAADALSAARRDTAMRLERAVGRELPPLKLEKARFVAPVEALLESGWGPSGADAVRFLIAANPGQEPGPLARVASGGELSRLMLALKVVLARASPAPCLIFDEVDSGIGGATAAAVGERLARVAQRLQVLVVTHSPQVAARGTAHFRVMKRSVRGTAATAVEALEGSARREEIARMLAGARITNSARAAADELLGVSA